MSQAAPLTGTETVHPNNQQGYVEEQNLSIAEQMYRQFKRRRLIAARDARDQVRTEFDDMPFLTYYDILKKADDQYVAPRKNPQDTSINLGTIRDKDTSLVEYAMAHDFEPIAQAYDVDDEMLEELAETNEDLVRKSLMIEDWRSKSKLVYRSMVAFGTALVEDAYIQRWVIDKAVKEKIGNNGGMAEEWTERMRLQYDGCESKLWDLRKCYFGDITKFFMNGPQGQPYFFTVEYVMYDVAAQFFQHWSRWKHVPNTVVQTAEVASASVFQSAWTLRPISSNVCEIIRYYDPVANEFGLSINGVEMLPLMSREIEKDGEKKTLISGFPLTEVSPSGAIPFAKYDLEPMHDFAYSKSQPAKMRVSADVENMMVKLFLQMFKQKVKPTMGNKSGRQFGPEITDPGTVINDIRDGDLFPVLPNYTGAVPADFSFFEIMKKELDKNSIERSFQGMDAKGTDETATKNMNDQKQQATLKVAALFDGIISGNTQLYWLRTYNIQKNWTRAIDVRVDAQNKTLEQIYRTVMLPAQIEGGQRATKKIVFTKDTPKLAAGAKRASVDDSFAVMQEEYDHKKKNGSGEIRITYLHPELYAQMKVTWFYSSVPVPNSTDPLSYMVFAKQIDDAMRMFGPDSLNVKRLKHRFARLTGNDFDTFFIPEKELEMKRAQGMAAPMGADPSKPTIPGKPTAAGPTIASATAGGNPAEKLAAMMQ